MLNLLFNPSILYISLAIIVGVVIMVLFYKYPVTKWIALTLFLIVFAISTVVSCVKLNNYYSAEGGIRGYIQSLIDDKNKAEEVKDLTFKLNNTTLSATANDGEYDANFTIDKVLKLDKNTEYGIFVNNIPCSNMIVKPTYASADFTQNFYDEENNVLVNDTLTIRIQITNRFVIIHLKTNGGKDAFGYWNKYFTKNDVVVELKPFGYSQGTDLEYSEDNPVAEYVVAKYYVGEELYCTQAYLKGTYVEFPTCESEPYFQGWGLDDGYKLNYYLIEENTNFYALIYEPVVDDGTSGTETPDSGNGEQNPDNGGNGEDQAGGTEDSGKDDQEQGTGGGMDRG